MGNTVEDTAHAGCVDGNLWYIIGHYVNYVVGQDRAFLEQVWSSLEQALLWLRYQDSNECGLLEVHELSAAFTWRRWCRRDGWTKRAGSWENWRK